MASVVDNLIFLGRWAFVLFIVVPIVVYLVVWMGSSAYWFAKKKFDERHLNERNDGNGQKP